MARRRVVTPPTEPKEPPTPGTDAPRELASLDDLRAADYNPRTITPAAAEGLTTSITEFGDLAGITWNARTGNLVSGHQRVDRLRKLGAKLDGAGFDEPRLVLPDGTGFPIRVVDWPVEKEKAANIAANNPKIGGDFTDGVDALLREVQSTLPDEVFKAMQFDVLAADLGFVPDSPLPTLPSGERQPFRNMTFLVHDAQYDVIHRALSTAKAAGEFTGPNDNSNGNALARMADAYLKLVGEKAS
jgi:hypothetical protein